MVRPTMWVLCVFLVWAPNPLADVSQKELFLARPDGHVHGAVIDTPDQPNGFGVVVMSSTSATDRDWTIQDDQSATGQQLTPGRDLGHALARRGYTVLRYDGFRTDDPEREINSRDAIELPLPESAALARLAIRTLSKETGIGGDKVIVVAHGTGVIRTVMLLREGERMAGTVLAGCGAFTRSGYASSRDLTKDANATLKKMDTNGDRRVTPDEYARVRAQEEGSALYAIDFEQYDRDGNGSLSIVEIAARNAIVSLSMLGETQDRGTHPLEIPWPEDIVTKYDLPTLLLNGSLDPRSTWGYIAQTRPRLQAMTDFTSYVRPGYGHLLGPQQGRRVGPMGQDIITMIGDWCDERFGDAG